MTSETSLPEAKQTLSVAIPTYGREAVLIETVAAVLRLRPRPDEVLVLDQTREHEEATARSLESWARSGAIRWLRLPVPSIPGTMNIALREAQGPIVLFLDDDIVPHERLIEAHRQSYAEQRIWAVVGQVLQPGQQPEPANRGDRGKGIHRDLQFSFNSTSRCEVFNCMAGNLSVRRKEALAGGGFDENFRGVAHRFETEFCRRLCRLGGTVIFEPEASIRHLRSPGGGTRTYGCHLRSSRPEHAVGDYYFALREARGTERATYIATRLFRAVRTRYHLSHPWFIPVKLLGEARGLLWAMQLARSGPRYALESNGGRPPMTQSFVMET